jgi:hypothetical protein
VDVRGAAGLATAVTWVIVGTPVTALAGDVTLGA